MTPQEIELHILDSLHTTCMIAFVLFAIFGIRALWARMVSAWNDHEDRIARLERMYEHQSCYLRRLELDTVKRNQELVSALDNVVSNIDKLATKIRRMDSGRSSKHDIISETNSPIIM